MPNQSEIIVLFDEFGTPSFKDNNVNTNNFFVGVSALYELNEEEGIFKSLDESMGLSKSKPLKNDKIGKIRARKIAEKASTNNFYITSECINLTNKNLAQITEDYVKFSNLGRKIWRDVKGRKDVHLLHSQILLSCIFKSILRFLNDHNEGNFHFDIFIDSYSYPTTDLHIIHDYCSLNLKKHIQDFIDSYMKRKVNVTIEPIKFFTGTTDYRERLIDSLTSVISRSLLKTDTDKFDSEPRKVLLTSTDISSSG